MTTGGPHPFDALCLLATKEVWCWKMVCTTCGHMLFRYSLRQLAAGQSPADPDWVVHRDNPVLRRGSPLRELGPIPTLAGWPLDEQRRLLRLISTADILLIARQCAFPDWLGYLGLALHYTAEAEQEDRMLTPEWIPKLLLLVAPQFPARQRLIEISANPASVLTWRDLEEVESGTAR